MHCWYEAGCNVKYQNCQKVCHRFLEMSHLINTCGMPNADKYIKPLCPAVEDVKSFDKLKAIKDNIVQFVDNGENLYIVSSNFGNGKTTWSLKLLYKYFDEIWCGNGFITRGYFIYVPEFLSKVSLFEFKSTPEYKELSKLISSVDVVIWDDIGCCKLRDNEIANLSLFLESRILKGKCNIFTGCLLANELEDAIGPRLYNRVWENSEVVQFVGKGKRR